MSVIAIILVYVFGSMAYSYAGGLFGRAYYKNALKRCGCGSYRHTAGEHEWTALFIGLLWPVTLPTVAGSMTASLIGSRAERLNRREKRKEIAHQRKMKELEAQKENFELAKQVLIHDGVGLETFRLAEAP